MSKTKKESMHKLEGNQLTEAQQRERVQQVINEASFRFKCCEIASKHSDGLDDLLANADTIYNYSFHIKNVSE
jgi:hypothetical protein